MGNISSADSTRRLEDEFFTPSDMIGRDIIVDKVTKKDKLVGKIELPYEAKLNVTLDRQNVSIKDVDVEEGFLYALKDNVITEEDKVVPRPRTYKIVRVVQVMDGTGNKKKKKKIVVTREIEEYNPKHIYAINQKVIYENAVWISTKDNNRRSPTETDWRKVKEFNYEAYKQKCEEHKQNKGEGSGCVIWDEQNYTPPPLFIKNLRNFCTYNKCLRLIRFAGAPLKKNEFTDSQKQELEQLFSPEQKTEICRDLQLLNFQQKEELHSKEEIVKNLDNLIKLGETHVENINQSIQEQLGSLNTLFDSEIKRLTDKAYPCRLLPLNPCRLLPYFIYLDKESKHNLQTNLSTFVSKEIQPQIKTIKETIKILPLKTSYIEDIKKYFESNIEDLRKDIDSRRKRLQECGNMIPDNNTARDIAERRIRIAQKNISIEEQQQINKALSKYSTLFESEDTGKFVARYETNDNGRLELKYLVEKTGEEDIYYTEKTLDKMKQDKEDKEKRKKQAELERKRKAKQEEERKRQAELERKRKAEQEKERKRQKNQYKQWLKEKEKSSKLLQRSNIDGAGNLLTALRRKDLNKDQRNEIVFNDTGRKGLDPSAGLFFANIPEQISRLMIYNYNWQRRNILHQVIQAFEDIRYPDPPNNQFIEWALNKKYFEEFSEDEKNVSYLDED